MRGERRRDAADELDIGLSVAVELVRGGVEPDELGLLAERGAEAEAEVERKADRERDVGLLQAVAAGAGERKLVIGGQAAAAHAVQEDRRARAPRQARAARLRRAPSRGRCRP